MKPALWPYSSCGRDHRHRSGWGTSAALLYAAGKEFVVFQTNLTSRETATTDAIGGILVHRHGPNGFDTDEKGVRDFVNCLPASEDSIQDCREYRSLHFSYDEKPRRKYFQNNRCNRTSPWARSVGRSHWL